MGGDETKAVASDPRKTLVANERIKLTATYMNGLALAIFAVGGVAPFVAALGIVTDRHGASSTGALVLLAVCSLASGALHLAGRSRLGRLDV